MPTDCVFCRELNGSRKTNFARLYPEIGSRIIAQTDEFVAFPCIGQLTKGHFLITPRQHICTMAQSTLQRDSDFSKISALILEVHNLLGFDPQESLYFEHGALDEKNGGCGIYHAHLHVLPSSGFVDGKKFFGASKCFTTKTLEHSYSLAPTNKPYAVIGSAQHSYHCYELDNALPSQFLRKNVATTLNITNWDWRNSKREPALLRILEEAQQ